MRQWEKLEEAKTARFDLRATLLGVGPPPSAPPSKAEQRSSGGWVIRPITGDLDWDAAEEDTLVVVRGEGTAVDGRGAGAMGAASTMPRGRRGLLLFGAFFVALGVLIGSLSLHVATAFHAACDQSPPAAPPPPATPPPPAAPASPPAPPGFPGQPTPLSSHLHGTHAEPAPVMRQPAPSPQSVEASHMMRLQNHWS